MNYLACPKCHEPLQRIDKTYQCVNHHNYDISKRGYVNLLLNPDKAHNNPGDSKESLIARKAFLDQGYYDPILFECTNYIKAHSSQPLQILDLGCGEGYYTYRAKQELGNENTYYGLDISKEAINMATRYDKDIIWMVGNSKNIPVCDHSMDVIMALFTVVNKETAVFVFLYSIIGNCHHVFRPIGHDADPYIHSKPEPFRLLVEAYHDPVSRGTGGAPSHH